MNATDFMRKWRLADLSERAGAQQHFCDLCDLLDHPKPADADPAGQWFTFEKGATKHTGGEGWLNPPEWVRQEILEFPGTVGGPWTRFIEQPTPLPPPSGEGRGGGAAAGTDSPPPAPSPSPPPEGRGKEVRVSTVRYPRLVPRDGACARKLKARTLTNLYNQRPTWLALAHRKLDAAVFAAYGWDPSLSDEEILEKLLALNLQGAAEGR